MAQRFEIFSENLNKIIFTNFPKDVKEIKLDRNFYTQSTEF